MLTISVLGSSSSGNCYLVQSPETNEILILDAGVPFKEIQKAVNFDFKNVSGVLITHEHEDHIKSAEKIAKCGIDIYASAGTFMSKNLIGYRYHAVKSLQEFQVGNFKILPFSIQHDAAEPLGFLIEYIPTKERILYATDTFYLKYKFKNINYFLLECNYIQEIAKKNVELGIVDRTRYKRLLKGHMSLKNCIDFLKNNVSSNTRKIVLIHLSNENSNEKIMIDEIKNTFGIDTVVASKNTNIDLKKYLF